MYRAEITGVGENVWSTNAKKFDSIEAASRWVTELSWRWTGMDAARVVPDDTPEKQAFDPADQNILFNFKM